MAKTTSKKVKVKPSADASLEIETPYPKEEKVKKSDKDYWGEKMVKLQDRVNELELTVSDMHTKLKQVAGRMGM